MQRDYHAVAWVGQVDFLVRSVPHTAQLRNNAIPSIMLEALVGTWEGLPVKRWGAATTQPHRSMCKFGALYLAAESTSSIVAIETSSVLF